jgi:hypothetical protein
VIRERVTVSSTPTEVCRAHWSQSAVLVENTGDVEVYVDTFEDSLEEDGQAHGLPVRPGEKVSVPNHRSDVALTLYGVVAAGEGELTYYRPGTAGWE